MKNLTLQEKLLEELSREFSFEIAGKQLRGNRGDVTLTVWLNPENRLKRVRTISIDCVSQENTEEIFYQYGLAYASRGWGGKYEPTDPGWPDILVADFKRWAIPFIREVDHPSKVIRLILSGDIPPSEGMGGFHGQVMSAIRAFEAGGDRDDLESIRQHLRNIAVSRSVARGLLMQPPFRALGIEPRVRWMPGPRRAEYTPRRSRFGSLPEGSNGRPA